MIVASPRLNVVYPSCIHLIVQNSVVTRFLWTRYVNIICKGVRYLGPLGFVCLNTKQYLLYGQNVYAYYVCDGKRAVKSSTKLVFGIQNVSYSQLLFQNSFIHRRQHHSNQIHYALKSRFL